jgi:RNA polymerase sigma-70 factor (ECF subfamily)
MRACPWQEDEQLVRDAQAGHRPAFEELVRRHADRLHAVVRRLVDTREEAEEVTQEAFLRAWRGLGRFKGDAAFSTWLYRIGVNEAHRRRDAPPARRRETSLEAQAVEPRAPGAVRRAPRSSGRCRRRSSRRSPPCHPTSVSRSSCATSRASRRPRRRW